ncbi:MAG: peptidase inhibitor family I36 protein [Opitutus sp.]
MRLAPLFVALTCFTSVVIALGESDHDRGREDRGRHDRGRRGQVTFYQDADFRGGSFTIEAGEDLENLTMVQFSNGMTMNDRISSIRIDGPVEVIVYRDSRYRGTTLRLTNDVRNLARDGRDWNDVISSVRTDHRRPGDERAEQARTDQMIERAYREVLQRRADETSLRTYRVRMIEEGWSDQDVRKALRKTEEYRGVAEKIVEKAYRDLLGRPAEPGGLRNYTDHMFNDGWSEADVRHSIQEGEEYRQRGKARQGG